VRGLTNKVTIQDIVQEERYKRVTTGALAITLGVTKGQITKYNKGENTQPSLKVARNVYKHFNCVLFPYSYLAVKGEN